MSVISDVLFGIGQEYGGGVIFHIDSTGHHGLISATVNQMEYYEPVEWGCYCTTIGTSTEIGTGQVNTAAIVNGCSQTGIAARICDELVLNGYDDWFLPSRDELNQMYIHQDLIGNFYMINAYWSSSEVNGCLAYAKFFNTGLQLNQQKYAVLFVRAIRAF